MRSRANSIISCGNYIGDGIASLYIIFISMFGWRAAIQNMGMVGMLVGFSVLAFIKEPKRESVAPAVEVETPPEPKVRKIHLLRNVFQNKITKWVSIGTMLKMSSPQAYYPIFFLRKFSNFSSEFAMLYALILAVCAPLSAMISGYFSDKYGVKYSMANSYIIMAGNFLALPTLIGALVSPNFYVAMACLSLNILSGEGWRSPSIAMISKSVKSRQFGKMLTAGQFFTDLAEAGSITFFGILFGIFGCGTSTINLGIMIASFGVLRYLGTSIAFHKAGNYI